MSVDDAPNLAPNTCASTRPRTKIHAISHIRTRGVRFERYKNQKTGTNAPNKRMVGSRWKATFMPDNSRPEAHSHRCRTLLRGSTRPFRALFARICGALAAQIPCFCATYCAARAATMSTKRSKMKSIRHVFQPFFVILSAVLWLSSAMQGQFTVGSGNAQKIPDVANEGAGPLDPAQPKGITPEQIVQKFAAKEAEFKQARDQYSWTQDVKIQDLDGDTPLGEFREVTDIVYDDRGRRVEDVKFAPQPSLQRVSMTKEDLDDIRHRLPFSLTTPELPKYQVMYVGQQK